jgi:ribose transport system permease protein
MQSLKSNALEPDLSDVQERGVTGAVKRLARMVPSYGVVLLTVGLIILFSVLLPQTFPTWTNARLILSNQAVTALLALAVMIPMVAGKIDISVGYGVVLWEILGVSLQTQNHLPWPLVILVVVVLGALLGVVNALLVEFAQIDAFIATLGTGTVVYAIALWYTNGQQVTGALPTSFFQMSSGNLLGIPLPAVYVLVLSVVMWLALDHTPLGRYLYAVGANPEAARLNGVSTRKYIVLAFVASGVITALAGVVLASRLRIGQIGVGLDYLLPALVAAFLGSTTIKPGRVNVWGTIVGIVILAVGISGLQQLGGAFWVEPMFNGVTLLVAIGLAGFAGRKRSAVKRLPPPSPIAGTTPELSVPISPLPVPPLPGMSGKGEPQ